MTTASIAGVVFLAPWMAWGFVAAVGLPLLAHLLSKTRYREVYFPATRLVQQAVAATSRIERPRDLILMLLRWLVLLLLVLAFMRPQWSQDAAAMGDGEGVALVVLLDASASMQRIDGGLTLYDRARRQAQQLIGGLDPSRDVAAVIRVDHAPSAILPEPTAQFSLLIERIENTTPGYTHANWAGAIAAAERLTRMEQRRVHRVTLSDQQGEQPGLSGDHIRIDGPTDNTAIRLVDVRPYPAIHGQPITATVEVKRFGGRPTDAQLSLQFAGQRVKQSLGLGPGETRRINVDLPHANGDREVLEVALDTPDAIAADNLTGVRVPVLSDPRALIIHDDNETSMKIAQRLALLLNPGVVAGVTLPNVDIQSARKALSVVDSADPALLRTIVLLHRGPLPDALSQALEAYAQAGGGIVAFVLDEPGSSTHPATASNIDFELAPLRVFKGPARAGLAALRWPGVRNMPIDPMAQPILMDEQERVIVAELLRGRGRLIAINATLSPEPGGLLAEPAFVVLFSELCRYASPGPALPMPAMPGDELPASLRNAFKTLVADGADPDAQTFTAPGPYAAMDEGGLIRDLIYAQLNPSESDTGRQAAWAAKQAEPGDAIRPSNALGVIDSLRHDPVELWPYVVLGILGLAAAESLLLHQFAGRRKPARQGGAE